MMETVQLKAMNVDPAEDFEPPMLKIDQPLSWLCVLMRYIVSQSLDSGAGTACSLPEIWRDYL